MGSWRGLAGWLIESGRTAHGPPWQEKGHWLVSAAVGRIVVSQYLSVGCCTQRALPVRADSSCKHLEHLTEIILKYIQIKNKTDWGPSSRWRDHLLPHKYIKNTSTCGTTPTEHSLNAGRRSQTSQKARHSVRVSALKLLGGGAEFRTLEHQKPPSPT